MGETRSDTWGDTARHGVGTRERKILGVEDGAAETVVGDEVVLVAVDGVGWRGLAERLPADLDGVVLDGLDSHEFVGDRETGNREAVDDDGEDDEEVDAGTESSDQVVLFLVALSLVGDEMTGVLEVENGTDTDGTEVSHEQRLFPVLDDSRHELVRHEDGRNAAEEENHKSHAEEPTDRDAGTLGVMELAPGNNGADVDETAKVQKDVDAGVDFVVAAFGLLEVLAVPVQSVAGDSATEQIVSANGATGTDQEETECGREEDV